MTAPGIPNEYSLSTACFGTRLGSIEDQIFAAVAMGFRRIELGLSDAPPSMDGLEESFRETGVSIGSMVVGCRDPASGELAATRLGSLDVERRDRAKNCVRRHVRLARAWGCPAIIVRGNKVERPELVARASELTQRMVKHGLDSDLKHEIVQVTREVQKESHEQVEHLCRSLYDLIREFPDLRFAIEPGRDLDDLLGFEAMGWVLDDLGAKGIGYWHDVGNVHWRERMGLPPQGQWLEGYGAKMVGIHVQDAAEDEIEKPLGLGEVDFKIVASYVPKNAERVLEISSRHGRAEILSSVQFLVDHGF